MDYNSFTRQPWSLFSPPNVECGYLSPLSEPCGDKSPHSTNSLIGLNDDQGPGGIIGQSGNLLAIKCIRFLCHIQEFQIDP